MNYVQAKEIEIRVKNDGSLIIKGMLPTEKLSESMFSKDKRSFFKEKISKGAFNAILEKETPKILLQHEKILEQYVENFEGEESGAGLYFKAEIRPTRELLENIDKITGLSFGFVKKVDKWDKQGRELIRTILEFKSLYEISVLYGEREPAYASRVLIGQSEEELKEEEIKALRQDLNKTKADILKAEIERLRK